MLPFDVYFLNEFVVLAQLALSVAEQNVHRIYLQVTLDAYREIVSIFAVESISRLSFGLCHALEELAQLLDGMVINLSSQKLLNCFLKCFWKLSWYGKNIGIFLQFDHEFSKLRLLILEFLSLFK